MKSLVQRLDRATVSPRGRGPVLLLLAGLIVCTGSAASDAAPAAKPLPPDKAGERRYLSLRVLAQQVEQAAKDQKSVSADARILAGIGWLEGYILDPANKDIILIGRASREWPPLRLDDLMVSLRSAWGDGGPPYCSLDPRPENMIKFRELAQTMKVDTPALRKANLVKARAVVGPQNVVTGGVPADSRFARVMIDADYHMKRVSQGHFALTGVTPLMQRYMESSKAQAQSGKPVTAGSTLSRFFFHIRDGDPTFSKDRSGVTWLQTCKVILLTEHQIVDAQGRSADGGPQDPDAQAFAGEFSESLLDAAVRVRPYAELINFYRLHALMCALRYQDADRKSGLDLKNYLPDYKYFDPSPLPKSLPGLANAVDAEISATVNGQQVQGVLFQIVCGGVDMRSPLTAKQFQDAPEKGGPVAAVPLPAIEKRNVWWAAPH